MFMNLTKEAIQQEPDKITFLPARFVLMFNTMRITKLHEQARRRIERLITDRGLKPGCQLPSETELANEFYVSRTTIRNALKILEQEGKVERRPGRGTIVRQPRLDSY
jgi:GntR family transcriptional regulator, transcriptional repressor for pyruvate dehydrogenase complex